MGKISDELRRLTNGDSVRGHMFVALQDIADRIDAELVELPKGAHGEYIRVGDTLDGYGKTIEVVEMRYGRGGWVLISRDGSGYADTFAFAHQTVEDVLTEMVAKVIERGELTNGAAQTIAEYSAKLRLADDAE